MISPSRSPRGFTLIELLIMVTMLAIVITAGVPTMGSGGVYDLHLVELQVNDAVDYAMKLAWSTGSTHGVVFDIPGDRFAIVDSAGRPVIDPLTRRPYLVAFGIPGQPSSIDFTAANFGPDGTALVIGPDGAPENGGTIAISCKGDSITLTVEQASGTIVSS